MLEEIINTIKEDSRIDKYFIFGAGSFGEKMFSFFEKNDIEISGYIDNDFKKVGKSMNGKAIFSFSDYTDNESSKIIICSTYSNEIITQISAKEIKNFVVFPIDAYLTFVFFTDFYLENKKRFEYLIENLDLESKKVYESVIQTRLSMNFDLIIESTYSQYFHPKVKPEPGDIIIDGGAYNGDTVIKFNNEVAQIKEIHSFEPSLKTFEKMKENIKIQGYSNVKINNLGLGEKKSIATLNYNNQNPAGSYISLVNEMDNSKESVNIISIDNYVGENSIEKVDLIKLDIEGFELLTLKGAHKTISEFMPKLQVCLYHSQEDLIDIYEYIRANWNYNIYIGHHSNNIFETVLYAERNNFH